MQDQVAALTQLGVRAAFLNSTQDAETARATERALLAGELDLLYVAPERLTTSRCLDLLDRAQLALFAIDEAHCVSQWGHDFRPEYLQLSLLHERYPQVPRIALTATADPQTRDRDHRAPGARRRARVRLQLRSPEHPLHHRRQGRCAQRSCCASSRDEHRGEAGIVYCLSRRKVDETAAWLAAEGRCRAALSRRHGHARRAPSTRRASSARKAW